MLKPIDEQFNDKTFKINYKLCSGLRSTCSSALVEGFLKEDNSAEVLKNTRSSEKKLTKSLSVGFNILNIDAR